MVTLLEPYPVIDTYADGISHVENMGGIFRAVFFVWARGPNGLTERICVAKIVRPVRSIIGASLPRIVEEAPLLGEPPPRSH